MYNNNTGEEAIYRTNLTQPVKFKQRRNPNILRRETQLENPNSFSCAPKAALPILPSGRSWTLQLWGLPGVWAAEAHSHFYMRSLVCWCWWSVSMSQQHNNVINLLCAGITVGALDFFQFKPRSGTSRVWHCCMERVWRRDLGFQC